ncbi:MAG: hypothetical protein JWP06_353 [Candidatus Saccharibacteria bacterium]|nr:hypothetical protein [Candidatus Saccharibacteria bacterium]
MKSINQTLTSSIGRTFIYLSIFIAGSALHELLFRLINPTIWSGSAIVLTLSTLGAFVLIGAVLACERHAMSRVTSAATLFILGVIALRIGHSVVPDPYLLVAAFCIATIGAQPALHRKLTSFKRTVLYSLLTIFISLAIAITFAYGMTMLDRLTISRQYDFHTN